MRKPELPLTHHTESSEAMKQLPAPCRALPEPVEHLEGYRGPKRFPQLRVTQHSSELKTSPSLFYPKDLVDNGLEFTLQSVTGAR